MKDRLRHAATWRTCTIMALACVRTVIEDTNKHAKLSANASDRVTLFLRKPEKKIMWRRKLTIALCTLCVSAPGWSSGNDDLWILPAATACVAQYPEFSSTRLGASLVNAPLVQQHINRAKAVFASNPWPGRAHCDELMHDKPDRQRDDRTHFNNMRDRHLDALKALAERFPEGWSFSKPGQ